MREKSSNDRPIVITPVGIFDSMADAAGPAASLWSISGTNGLTGMSEIKRMRREQRRRQRHSLNRWYTLVSHAIILAALAGICTFCILEDPECWSLAAVVFAVYLFKSELFSQLRNMLRWANHQKRDPNPPSMLQTIYRGFPPVAIKIPTKIPQHVLNRPQPDFPTEAERKARRLLWSMLDPDQRLQYSRNSKFIVDLPPPYHHLLKPYAILGDGYVHWPDGQRQCVHPKRHHGPLPMTDSVIAQLIHLRNDPGVLFRLRTSLQ